MTVSRAQSIEIADIVCRGSAIAHLLGISVARLAAEVRKLLERGFSVDSALDSLVLDWAD